MSGTRLSAALLCISLAALLMSALTGQGAVLSAIKLVSATLAVGLVPGMLCLLLAGVPARASLLEVAALGIALSFAIVQVFTIVILLLHIPVAGAAAVLAWGCAGASLVAAWRERRVPGRVSVGREEVVLGGLILLLAALLYLRGSPVVSAEDQIHIGVIRRLSYLTRPALDNFYVTPGLVYTYPFPGLHVFLALVARQAERDAARPESGSDPDGGIDDEAVEVRVPGRLARFGQSSAGRQHEVALRRPVRRPRSLRTRCP